MLRLRRALAAALLARVVALVPVRSAGALLLIRCCRSPPLPVSIVCTSNAVCLLAVLIACGWFEMSCQIQFIGQQVTVERVGSGWVATGWEQGLPVARRPITAEQLADLQRRYPYVLIGD